MSPAAHSRRMAVQECPFSTSPQDMARFNPKLAHFLALCVKVNTAHDYLCTKDGILMAYRIHPGSAHGQLLHCTSRQQGRHTTVPPMSPKDEQVPAALLRRLHSEGGIRA